MSGRVEQACEGESLVAVVGDGEALEEVRELADDVEIRLSPGLEEGSVPRTSSTGELVAWLGMVSI